MALVIDNAYAPGWRDADTACEACGWRSEERRVGKEC